MKNFHFTTYGYGNRVSSAKVSIFILCTFLLLFLCVNDNINAQSRVFVYVGSGQTYPTLKSAFDAINAGTLTGEIQLIITSSITETSTATLNASGTGGANYSQVVIYPSTSNCVISGDLTAPLILLNGADFVQIDGRVNMFGVTPDLKIINYSKSSLSQTSTICLQNSAQFNTIQFCRVYGFTTNSNSGIIFFSTSSTGNGNNSNIISYCDFFGAENWSDTTSGVSNAIFSLGNNGYVNRNNMISNNEFYLMIRKDASSNVIHISSYNHSWYINSNKMAQWNDCYKTVSSTFYFIRIETTVGNGGGHYISRNKLGKRTTTGGGYFTVNALNTSFSMYGIYLDCSADDTTFVNGNEISSINILQSYAYQNLFHGIYLYHGKFAVGKSSPNYIGELTGNSSINISGSTSEWGDYRSRGIYFYCDGNSSANISNNKIGSITASATGTKAHSFIGIETYNTNNAENVISNNQIGSTTTPQSIILTTNQNVSGNENELGGIKTVINGFTTISGNTICNLYFNDSCNNYSYAYGIKNTGGYGYIKTINNTIGNITTTSKRQIDSPDQLILTGIVCNPTGETSGNDTLIYSGNKVFGLSALYNGNISQCVAGMIVSHSYGIKNLRISNNMFYNISLNSPGNGSSIRGIHFEKSSAGNKWFALNNIINLGTEVNKNCKVFGFFLHTQGGDSLFINNNSVYIGGSSISPANASTSCITQDYQFWYSPNTYKLRLFNNILYNARSNSVSGDGKHYAMQFWSTNMKIDYNDYYVSGTGGILANINSDINSLSQIKAVTKQDNYSVNGNPYFLADSTLKIDSTNTGCWNVYKKGVPITNITTDFRGIPRSNSVLNGPVCIGAHEFTTAVNPPIAVASGSPSPNDTTLYSQSNRTLFKIIWGSSKDKLESGGLKEKKSNKARRNSEKTLTLPSTVSLQYYSGQTPPDTADIPVAKLGKGYYYIDTDREPSSTYSVVVYWGNHELGNITDTSKLILAMYNTRQKVWRSFPRGSSGDGYSIVNDSAKTIRVNGLKRIDGMCFAFTDNDYLLSSKPIPSGSYSVGTSTKGDYYTITECLDEAKYRGISGSVRFLLTDTLYSDSEIFPIIIDSIPGAGPDKTVTLKPSSGIKSLIKGNCVQSMIQFSRGKYFTIDGSDGGNGISLTFENRQNGYGVFYFANNSSYDTIRSCKITGAVNQSQSGLILLEPYIYPVSNITIDSCILSSGISSYTHGIYANGTGGEINTITISNNRIYDFQNSGIKLYYRCTNIRISGNDIYEHTAASAANFLYGIHLSGYINTVPGNVTITNNTIHDLNSSYSGSSIYGMEITCYGDFIFYNNLIFLEKSVSNSASQIIGALQSNLNGTTYFYNNLIYIGGTSTTTAGSPGSACYQLTGDTGRKYIYNNIFVNTRSNTTSVLPNLCLHGFTYQNLIKCSSDYNNILANGNGGRLSEDCNTLSDWVAAKNLDKSSYSWPPEFIPSSLLLPDSTISGCWNLYMKGMPLNAVPLDYRGLPRSTSVLNGQSCIGPYEFKTNTAPPLAAPSGSPSPGGTTHYTQSEKKLMSINWGTSDNNIPEKSPDALPSFVNLKYYTGVTPPDTGNIPIAKTGKSYWFVDSDRNPANSVNLKIYWGDNELGNITDTSKLILSVYNIRGRCWTAYYRGTSGQGYLTVNHTEKSITLNNTYRIDSIYIALTSSDQPLNSGLIEAGDYTVGSSGRGGHFFTITDALSSLSGRGIAGNVRFLLIDTLYSSSETFPLVIDSIPGASETSTVTLKPYNGVNAVIRGNSADALVNMNQCKYVTINGSNGSKGKSLTLYNTDENGVTIKFQNDASYNSIKNTVIKGNRNYEGSGIVFFGETMYASGCDYNTIDSCSISGGSNPAKTGICFYGGPDGVYGNNNIISNNKIYNFKNYGINVYYNYSNLEICGNEIYEETPQPGTKRGIILNNNIQKIDIHNNYIHNLDVTETNGFICGINSGAAGEINIYNNIVYLFVRPENQGSAANVMEDGSGGTVKLYNNLFYIGGPSTSASWFSSVCYSVSSQIARYVNNNIMCNNRYRVSGTGNIACLYFDYSWYVPTFYSDNNNIYPGSNMFAYDGTDVFNNLTDWRNSKGKDLQSYSSSPVFIDTLNFLIDSTVSSCWNFYKKGIPVTSVTSDYRGLPRSTSILNGPTCIGPYEFTTSTAPPPATPSGSPSPGGTTSYTQSGHKVIDITWGLSDKFDKKSTEQPKKNNKPKSNLRSGGEKEMSLTALPAVVEPKYISGVLPPDLPTTTHKRGYGIWYIDVDANPTSPVTVTIYYGLEQLGDVSSESNLILCKYDSTTRVWVPYYQGVGDGYSVLNTTAKTITVSGITELDRSVWALTDNTSPISRLQLTLTALVAGFYDSGTGQMRTSDRVLITLRNTVSPYALISSDSATMSTSGAITFLSEGTVPGTDYFIVFNHRNSVETWSAAGQSFSRITGRQTYNFTTAATQAYGDNLKNISGVFCIYNADMNQDGSILTDDYDIWYNDFIAGLSGSMIASDLNGDGSILTDDYDIWYNNFISGVSKQVPPALMNVKPYTKQDRLYMLREALKKNTEKINRNQNE